TDELMAIWHENDRGGWTDLEFEVIEGILLERLGKLPRRAGDPSDDPEVDEEADSRIRQLWLQGDTDSLRRIMRQDPDLSLQMDAAEALADLGDEDALDALIEMLDDEDEERGDVAARILDWLDLPRGNAALRERGYEFETDDSGGNEVGRAPTPTTATLVYRSAGPVSEQSTIEPKESRSWTSRPPGVQGGTGTPAGQDHGKGGGASLGTIITGAIGGLLGFLAFTLGLGFLGVRPLPYELSEWLTPSTIYSVIESLAVGAAAGTVGRTVARAMAIRDGDEVDEQDARLVLGALIAGAVAATLLGLLRFAFGS
ncbi:MAG TPA: HEAT repeat domain-containing protein, partial [Anaerolineales bacterium]|nr:HEAT repeat domain-containing protein [Anaerolineales bacterium]